MRIVQSYIGTIYKKEVTYGYKRMSRVLGLVSFSRALVKEGPREMLAAQNV